VVRINVKNTSGSTLVKGAPVYATGSVGASGEVEVALADATSSATMPAIGLVEEELVANAEGEAIVIGTLFGVDTSAYAINGAVYVAVGGGLTPTRPTGATELVQNIGRVTRVHASTGIIVVMGPARVNDTPNAISARTVALNGTTSGTVTIQPAAAAGTWSLTLPTTDGNSGEFLQTNGSGVTTWATATAGAAGSDTQVQYNSGGALAGDAGLTYNAATNTLTTDVAQLGTAGSTTGELKMSGSTSGTVTIKPSIAAGTYTLTLPTDDGAANQVLRTDGSGVLSWNGAPPGGSSGQVQYNASGTLSGDAGLTYDAANDTLSTKIVQLGTAGSALGQLKMSGNTSGTVTLQTAAAAGTYTLTLPTDDGTANQVLQTDGSGVLSWVANDAWTYVKIGSTFSTTSTTAVSVTGLAFTPSASTDYEIEVMLLLQGSASGIAVRPGFTWPTGYSDGAGYLLANIGAANSSNGNLTLVADTAGTNASGIQAAWGSINKSFLTKGFFYLRMGASPSGDFQITVASESALYSVSVMAGSFLRYRTV